MDTAVLQPLKDLVPGQEDLYSVGLSFLVWNIINLVVMNLNIPDSHLKRNDMLDMRNRIVSFFHGAGMLIFTGYHMYFLHSECGANNTNLERNIITISLGYFLYDFFAMAYFGLLDVAMIIHHGVCMLGYTVVLS